MSTASLETITEEGLLTADHFWEMASELLYSKVLYDESYGEYVTVRPDTCSCEDMNLIIVSYITLCTTHCEQMGKLTKGGEDSFHYSAAKFLVECVHYQQNLAFCIRKLLSLLNYTASSASNLAEGIAYDQGAGIEGQIRETLVTNQRMVRIIGWILYINFEAERDQIMAIFEEFQGFLILCETLTGYCKLKEKTKGLEEYKDTVSSAYYSTYSNFLELLYEVCKTTTISPDDLVAVDSAFLQFLFRSLKVATREEDELNFLKFKLLLVLNEQYMVSFYSSDAEHRIPNKAFEVMIEDMNFRNFSECLMLNFNREKDHVIQILMLKVLYMVFTTSSTCQWIYLNDLKVLVDIFLRELNDLSLVEDESLINTYLRVVYPMLMFSSLKSETYKRDSVVEVMRYLAGAEESTDTTKRLSQRCLELKILAEPERKSFSSVSSSNTDIAEVSRLMNDDQASITSNSSNGSSGRPRKRPPPPPLPRKLHSSRNSSSSDITLARTGRN